MEEIKKIFARELRKNQTTAEEKVWKILRNRRLHSLKFRRQHVIEGFVVDFYCHEYKLAIEIDGCIHENQKEYDKERQEVIESKGVRFIRITNNEIFNNSFAFVKQIRSLSLRERVPEGRVRELHFPPCPKGG